MNRTTNKQTEKKMHELSQCVCFLGNTIMKLKKISNNNTINKENSA